MLQERRATLSSAVPIKKVLPHTTAAPGGYDTNCHYFIREKNILSLLVLASPSPKKTDSGDWERNHELAPGLT